MHQNKGSLTFILLDEIKTKPLQAIQAICIFPTAHGFRTMASTSTPALPSSGTYSVRLASSLFPSLAKKRKRDDAELVALKCELQRSAQRPED